MCKYFLPSKTPTSLKEKLCLKSLCFTNVIGHRFTNLHNKPTRTERGMLLRQKGRKEKKNSNEKAEKWNLGVNMEAIGALTSYQKKKKRTIYFIATIKSTI